MLQVQIRPWNLSDSDFVMDGSQPLDPRKTIFVGGVPRPLRAGEWARAVSALYAYPNPCLGGYTVNCIIRHFDYPPLSLFSPGSSQLCRLGFRRLKKPRHREMSARGYALYCVCLQLSFFQLINLSVMIAEEISKIVMLGNFH